jgi:hypothetical protein
MHICKKNKPLKVFNCKIISILMMLLILTTSCNKDGCTDTLAENFDNKAKNDDGSCQFLTDNFTGRFLGNETCDDNSNATVELIISRQFGTNNKIVLNNFTRYSIAPTAIITGNNFVIENQTHPSGFLNVNINGNGTISNNTLTINYITNGGDETIECSYNGTK